MYFKWGNSTGPVTELNVPDIQEAYLAYQGEAESNPTGIALQAAYLAAYYLNLSQL